MIAPLAALVLVATAAPMTRAEFRTRLEKVELGWTKTRVQRLLGSPDDVWLAKEKPPATVHEGQEVWGYGTHGRQSFPTRGRVHFKDDKVVFVRGQHGEAPSPAVISDAELDDALGVMCRWMHRPPYDDLDNLHLLRTANSLIALGTEKALAALAECCRLLMPFDDPYDDEWMFWVVRLAFESKTPGQVISLPRNGIRDLSKEELAAWPTYPMLVVGDVPFYVAEKPYLFGPGERFYGYMRRCSSDWKTRTKPYRPVDDPFSSYEKLIASKQWPYKFNSSATPGLETEGRVLQQVLRLVRTAYDPGIPAAELNDLDSSRASSFRKGFRTLGSRWDERKQLFVRGDGSVLNKLP